MDAFLSQVFVRYRYLIYFNFKCFTVEVEVKF